MQRPVARLAFSFVVSMPTYDARCPHCEDQHEIVKPMMAPMPTCPDCGTQLVRLYAPICVQYNAPGFHTTEYTRFEKQVGTERAARFRAQRDDAERRAKSGKLTEYERVLETV